MPTQHQADRRPAHAAPVEVRPSQHRARSEAWGGPWVDAMAEGQILPFGSLSDIDPVVEPEPGLVTRKTPIGSIGSCFSGQLKKWLIKNGYNYIQAADGPTSERGSGRFGNVQSTAVLRQQFDAAAGAFAPTEPLWATAGGFVDPYRKLIGWDTAAEAHAERREHYAMIPELVRRLDVLIITMGVSEVWRSRADGSVFGGFPPRDVYDPERHEQVMLSPDENLDHLNRFYDRVREFNPRVRLVCTLSPVRLRATYASRNIWEANAVSKASLRIALDRFARANPEVIYFPSYEIATDLADKRYHRDNSHVERTTVARIMITFMRNFGDLPPQTPWLTPELPPDKAARDAMPVEDLRRMMLHGVGGSYEGLFRKRYVLERLARLADRVAARPVALYGAGAHTRTLLAWLHRRDDAPNITAILDDQPPADHIGGIPVVEPAEADASRFAAVVASSDRCEATIADRAAAWAQGRCDVVRLYDAMPDGPFATPDMRTGFAS